MGEVFLAEDLKLQRRAALKLISPTLTRDETRRQRFVQEARLAASIDHPHIAAIYDIGEVDDRTYIAMEYVEGSSLREVLKAGPLRLRQALDYAVQAGDALAKVHGRGVVHRDLKPENVLIANDGYLKIIDFGLAKLVDHVVAHGTLPDAATKADAQVRTAEGVVMGTMGYMSPEQVRGETVDARSDIFSFGTVLYEMVTAVAPFRKRSAADTISAILGEMPAPPRVDDVTAGTELQRVLRKCLAKEPDSRYQGMRDLVVDLRQLRESITSSETMSRPIEPTRDSVIAWWQRPPVWIGAAALAGAIAAATMWSMRRSGEAPTTALSEASARPAVAVVAFEVMGSSPEVAWLAKGMPSLLITGLAQTPDIEVVGNERLGDAARLIGASTLDAVERSQLAELARHAGARFIVNGTIVQAGADLRIDARVEDLSTGAVRLAETVRGPDALALADDLSARIRRGLDVKTAPGTVRKVADVASASVDAYRAFTAGVEARSNERNADARGLFEEAIRVDPEFALAYVHLAETNLHEGRISQSRRALSMAAQRLDRMPERDAVLVRAGLARDAGRIDEADQLLEALVARYRYRGGVVQPQHVVVGCGSGPLPGRTRSRSGGAAVFPEDAEPIWVHADERRTPRRRDPHVRNLYKAATVGAERPRQSRGRASHGRPHSRGAFQLRSRDQRRLRYTWKSLDARSDRPLPGGARGGGGVDDASVPAVARWPLPRGAASRGRVSEAGGGRRLRRRHRFLARDQGAFRAGAARLCPSDGAPRRK